MTNYVFYQLGGWSAKETHPQQMDGHHVPSSNQPNVCVSPQYCNGCSTTQEGRIRGSTREIKNGWRPTTQLIFTFSSKVDISKGGWRPGWHGTPTSTSYFCTSLVSFRVILNIFSHFCPGDSSKCMANRTGPLPHGHV